MKSVRVFISGLAVYFAVATLHACGSASPIVSGGATASGGDLGGAPSATGGKSSGKGGAGGIMDPVPNADADESGSRLKVKRVAWDDGAKQFAGMYDSKRKEDCGFLPMGDGKSHCVPISSAEFVNYYSDPACINVLVPVSFAPCYPKRSYAYSQAANACGAYTFYPIVQAPAPPALYTKSGMSCVAVSLPPNSLYYSIGPAIDPSEFVAGAIAIDP